MLRLKPHTQRHLLVFLRGRGRMGRTDWEEALSVELISVLIAIAGRGRSAVRGGDPDQQSRTAGGHGPDWRHGCERT